MRMYRSGRCTSFNILEREFLYHKVGDENERKYKMVVRILFNPLEGRSEIGRIAYCFMSACVRKVRWLSMTDRVPSDRGEFKPMEIPPETLEVGSSLRDLGEEITWLCMTNPEQKPVLLVHLVG